MIEARQSGQSSHRSGFLGFCARLSLLWCSSQLVPKLQLRRQRGIKDPWPHKKRAGSATAKADTIEDEQQQSENRTASADMAARGACFGLCFCYRLSLAALPNHVDGWRV